MTTIPMAASHPGIRDRTKVRVVVTGKGGVGKTTLTALLAHTCAGQGYSVLAVDGDPQQNLAATLGLYGDEAAAIVPLAERSDYIAEKTGTGPGSRGLMVLNPDTADVVERAGTIVDVRLRLLVMGGVKNAGSGCLCPEYSLLASVLRNARSLPDEIVLLDTPAGLEHFGRAVAEGFDMALIVSDGSYNAMTVARDLCRLAKESGIRDRVLIVNRVRGTTRLQHIRTLAGDSFSRVFTLPDDPCVPRHEPSVVPLLGSDCPVMAAVKDLAGSIIAERAGS